jgi:hypothetical protein
MPRHTVPLSAGSGRERIDSPLLMLLSSRLRRGTRLARKRGMKLQTALRAATASTAIAACAAGSPRRGAPAACIATYTARAFDFTDALLRKYFRVAI